MNLSLLLSAALIYAHHHHHPAPQKPKPTLAPTPIAFSGYLFDAVQLRAPFRPAWDKMMKDVQPTPDWLRQFDHDFDGVSGEMKPVTLDGKTYYESFVCKPDACADHRFIVMFTNDATKAFGALTGKNEPPAFFGSPSASEQAELTKGK